MKTLTLENAKRGLAGLISEVSSSHIPISIKSEKNNAVLLSENDWDAIQETLYLLSIPGMRKKIRNGLKTPISKCSKVLNW